MFNAQLQPGICFPSKLCSYSNALMIYCCITNYTNTQWLPTIISCHFCGSEIWEWCPGLFHLGAYHEVAVGCGLASDTGDLSSLQTCFQGDPTTWLLAGGLSFSPQGDRALSFHDASFSRTFPPGGQVGSVNAAQFPASESRVTTSPMPLDHTGPTCSVWEGLHKGTREVHLGGDSNSPITVDQRSRLLSFARHVSLLSLGFCKIFSLFVKFFTLPVLFLGIGQVCFLRLWIYMFLFCWFGFFFFFSVYLTQSVMLASGIVNQQLHTAPGAHHNK